MRVLRVNGGLCVEVWSDRPARAGRLEGGVCVTLGVAAVVVAAPVPADVAVAETVTVRVTMWLPEAEWPIAQPTTPAGTSNAKNRSQMKTSPTVTAGSHSLFGATAERYRL